MKNLIEQIQEMEVDEETLSLLSDSSLIHNTYKLAYKQALTDVLSLIHPYAKYKDDMKNLICYFANLSPSCNVGMTREGLAKELQEIYKDCFKEKAVLGID